jgi:hypothetical protein
MIPVGRERRHDLGSAATVVSGQGAGSAGDAAGLPDVRLQAARGRLPRKPLIVARACLEMLKAGSSAAKGVADVQVTFAGPY